MPRSSLILRPSLPALAVAVVAFALPATASASLFSPLRVAATPTPAPAKVPAPTPTPVKAPTPAPTPTPAAPTVDELSLVPSPSTKTATCNEPKVFKPFAGFGDAADYAFAPGGTFEGDTAGWSFSGASVVSGNDTSGVYGGSKALRIAKGGRVVSPWFCVSDINPSFRYTTKGGEVEMEIDYIVIGSNDIDDSLTGETNGGASWAPSAIHGLATEIPGARLKKGVLGRLIWEAEDNVVIDNVLVDPYRRG